MGTAITSAVTKTESKNSGIGLPLIKELPHLKNALRPTLKVVLTCALLIVEHDLAAGGKRAFDHSDETAKRSHCIIWDAQTIIRFVIVKLYTK